MVLKLNPLRLKFYYEAEVMLEMDSDLSPESRFSGQETSSRASARENLGQMFVSVKADQGLKAPCAVLS